MTAIESTRIERVRFLERARAYCGPAHGRSWEVDAGASPPLVVWLEDGSQLIPYRLALRPRTRRPARDYLGNYLYIAAS